MRKRISSKTLIVLALMLQVVAAYAQNGAYSSFSPYSIFAFGDLSDQGSAYNSTMGGVGIASRNKRFINYTNPAAITARDSLSVMMDFSLSQNNKYFRQGDIRSANNTFTVNDCMLTVPLYKSLTALVGIMPFSSQGYKYFEYPDDPATGIIGSYGYSAEGQGSLYQIVAALGYTFFDRLSVGAQYMRYFGKFESAYQIFFINESFQGTGDFVTSKLYGNGAKLGLQYEHPFGKKSSLTFGATYRLSSSINGTVEDILLVDTTGVNVENTRIAAELGVGVAVNIEDKYRFEIDYSRSDWRKSGLDNSILSTGVGFAPSVSQAIRIGAEIVPNRNDIRYYLKKVAYRVGAYRKSEYYTLNGSKVCSTGVTLGGTFPIFRWNNGLTVGVDVGKRGNIQNNMIREWYCNVSIGFNLYDIWFQKYRYE